MCVQHVITGNLFFACMEPENIPFQTINWDSIPKISHAGTTGTAWWQTIQFKGLRLRTVEYSEGYLADHWCQKGHIVYCLEGEVTTEMENGESYTLSKGMCYIVSDDLSSHRSVTKTGVKLLIIDGDFLKTK
jgi:quercetin dioxygenase-like cupin family protein